MPNTAENPIDLGEGEALGRAADQRRPELRVEDSGVRTLVFEKRRIAYQDVGAGPVVILAHCSGGSHHAWRSLIDQLRARYRVIAPDLIGYGASEPWPANASLHPLADANVVVALANLAAEPVHLVGHSYGGTVALEAARLMGARVKSLTLVEPVAFHLLRPTGRISEWHEISQVGDQVMKAMRLRQDAKAASAFMGYWIGRLRWWLMPPRGRQRIIAAMGKVAAEFEALHRLTPTIGDYRGVFVRARLIVGQRTRQPARAVVEELARILPDATVREVAGAGHMSPFTHAERVNTLIAGHIDSYEEDQARRTRARVSAETILRRRSTGRPRARLSDSGGWTI